MRRLRAAVGIAFVGGVLILVGGGTAAAGTAAPGGAAAAAPTTTYPSYSQDTGTTTTTVAPTTTSTVAPLPGNLAPTPSTLPLTYKKQSGHVSPVFAALSGAGFAIALILLATQAVLTRKGRHGPTL